MKKSTKVILGIGATCACIYGANRLFHYLATNKKLLTVSNSSIYKWTYGDVYFTKKGSGSPVLLLHHIDFFGSSFEFQKTIDKLAESHTVYAIDFLGCGRSEKEKTEYTNFLYVQLVCNFIEDVVGERCDIIASGNASNVAVMASRYNSDLFGKLIFINPKDIYETAPDMQKAKLCKLAFELPLFGTFAYNLASSKCRLAKILKKEYFYNEKKCTDRFVNTYLEAAHLGDANAKYVFASMTGNFLAANVIPALKNTDDLTIIVGAEDKEQEKTAAHFEDYIENLAIISIPESTKLPHFEQAEEFVRVVTACLK